MYLQNEFFEKTARKHPSFIAVDDHGRKTTYKDLENFSNKLGNFLGLSLGIFSGKIS